MQILNFSTFLTYNQVKSSTNMKQEFWKKSVYYHLVFDLYCRRVIKSHMPFAFLPPELTEKVNLFYSDSFFFIINQQKGTKTNIILFVVVTLSLVVYLSLSVNTVCPGSSYTILYSNLLYKME